MGKVNKLCKFTIENKMVFILSKRNGGKSVLAKSLIQASRSYFDKIIVICPTESVNNFYSTFLDKEFIFDEFSEEYVSKLFSHLEKVNGNKPKNEQKKVLLVLDDVIADTNLRSSKILKKVFVRSRHINLSLLVLSQALMEVTPVMRNNIDYILVSTINHSSLLSLCEQFCSGYNFEKKDFTELYYRICKNYTWLGINLGCTKSNNLNEVYFSYRVEDIA